MQSVTLHRAKHSHTVVCISVSHVLYSRTHWQCR